VSYTYEKNPNYFKKGLPYLDGIILHVIRDRPAQMAAFVAGRVDMTNPSLGMPTKSIYDDHMSKAPTADYQILEHTLVRLLWFNLNEPDNPWNDVKVRQAISLVLEREQLILAAVGDLGWGRMGGFMVPESPYGLPPDELAKAQMWDKPYEERVAEAQRLMKEAGYENGFEMRLMARTLTIYKRILTQVADLLLQHLNIETTIDLPETARAQEMRSARDFDMYLEVMYSNIFDPDEIMGYWVTGGSENWTGYSNPRIDELFKKQSEASTLAERVEATQEIEQILLEDAPAIPTFFLQYGIGVYPQVKNYVPARTVYSVHLQMEQVWLEE
jgi:peptide/nickel transport system substrate-binding protein